MDVLHHFYWKTTKGDMLFVTTPDDLMSFDEPTINFLIQQGHVKMHEVKAKGKRE